LTLLNKFAGKFPPKADLTGLTLLNKFAGKFPPKADLTGLTKNP